MRVGIYLFDQTFIRLWPRFPYWTYSLFLLLLLPDSPVVTPDPSILHLLLTTKSTLSHIVGVQRALIDLFLDKNDRMN